MFGFCWPPDALDLALPMTFHDWLVSPDLILNSSTWPLPRSSLDLPFECLLGIVVCLLLLSWGTWWLRGSVGFQGFDPSKSNPHIPPFTLNAPLTTWFVYIDLTPPVLYIKLSLCTVTSAQDPAGSWLEEWDKKRVAAGALVIEAPPPKTAGRKGSTPLFTRLSSSYLFFPHF